MKFLAPRVSSRRFSWIDAAVLIFIIVVLYAILTLGAGMKAPLALGEPSGIDLDPAMLPYYAGRSLIRMFIAFAASLLFSLGYGYVAAKNHTAEIVLVPLLDMLQSIPVLGFLSATIAAFIAFFPGSLLGVEIASIFAIFTGQAWNMTFSFYHSLKTIPKELQEAAAILRLNAWQRFLRLEVPFSAIGLVWNGMMSFGGGWFFLAASEAITVLGQDIRLPGVGSYLASAIDVGDLPAILWSIATMVSMIVLVDQLFWRPVVVWSQKFKIETSTAAEAPTSFVYDLLSRSRLVGLIYARLLAPVGKVFDQLMNRCAAGVSGVARDFRAMPQSSVIRRLLRLFCLIAVFFLLQGPLTHAVALVASLDVTKMREIIQLGFLTLGRVSLAVLIGVLWTVPVGVWIGSSPRLARLLQPVVQIAASFPANMLFPFITILFLKYQVNFEWGSIALMMLGTQWYILFNVIAGAMAIPNDLREASHVFQLRGWQKWRKLILPGIFPFLITGMITAAGGAWNASIVAEIVNWHDHELVASGLGSYISKVTEQGDWPGIILGITVMCLIVVLINRFVFRRLYAMAAEKYHLD